MGRPSALYAYLHTSVTMWATMVARLCPQGHRYTGPRCPTCSRTREARRGTPAQRGYGAAHRAVRRSIGLTLPAKCGGHIGRPYCGVVILPGERYDAAHVVDGRPEYGYVAAHPRCNQRAKGSAVAA